VAIANAVVLHPQLRVIYLRSNPAAALPIHPRPKNWIPLSAPVIGGLEPNFAYYLPMPEHFKQNSHMLLGTFPSSLPGGIFAWFIFFCLAAGAIYWNHGVTVGV
jgi:hypothetical protein